MTIVLAALIGAAVGYAAFGDGRLAKNLAIIKTYRPIHFLANIPVVLLVLAAAILLITYVPFFDKNPFLWAFTSIFGGGDGKGTGNVLFAGIQWKLYAALFLPVLLIALPYMAQLEEKDYREGTRDWPHGIRRSIRFGLVHLFMLIPLGAAVALSIGGLWFTHHYFKGGVQRSTVYHATYNTMIVGVLAASIFA